MEKARQICIEMITQRKYTIVENEFPDRILALKKTNEMIAIFFILEPKFNIKCLIDYISRMKELEINHAIMVYLDGITPQTKRTKEQSVEMRMEFFSAEDLQYNITKHRLQPEFSKLEKPQANFMKREYGTKFPIMKIDDPVSRFYDYEVGDIIRVGRGDSISYRIVK